MRVPRLFTHESLSIGTELSLDSKKSHYLTHVLRLKENNEIILFNGDNAFDFSASIIKAGKKVILCVNKKHPTNTESKLNISIYQALSKSDHIDFTIQKCTELGVNSFHIFNSKRTQSHLKAKVIEKKLQHWNAIAQSACEQCGRSITPSIYFHSQFTDSINTVTQQHKIMLDFSGRPMTQELSQSTDHSIAILLGAEGGLSPDEIEFASQNGFNKVHLGPRVLRTETAAIAATTVAQALIGDLGI